MSGSAPRLVVSSPSMEALKLVSHSSFLPAPLEPQLSICLKQHKLKPTQSTNVYFSISFTISLQQPPQTEPSPLKKPSQHQRDKPTKRLASYFTRDSARHITTHFSFFVRRYTLEADRHLGDLHDTFANFHLKPFSAEVL